MRLLLVLSLLLCCAAPAFARAIDTERSRFLAEPHGRPGTCAPFRLVFKASASTEEIVVEHGNTRLTRRVAAEPGETVEVRLPVWVAPGVTIRVAGDVWEPRQPPRRVEPSFEQPYAAVFAADAVYVRTLVPTQPGRILCDYYENREFFDDWRMFDGYDAIVLFKPEVQRPPAGAQRAIAEFCAMGGVALIVGSFRMGEQVEGLPPPAEPEHLIFSGVSAQRMAYGAGAIYRFDFAELAQGPGPQLVLRQAILDHTWFGSEQAPAGPPQSRVAPAVAPGLMPGTPEPPRVGAPFFGLAAALLLLCALAPRLARRLHWPGWASPAAIAAGAACIGALALLLPQPRPLVDVWAVARAESGEEGRPAALRALLLPGAGVPAQLEVPLDGEERWLGRPMRTAQGAAGWQIDMPGSFAPEGEPFELRDGRVGDAQFRDFAARAYRAGSGFQAGRAPLLEWWLEQTAYRGRAMSFAPAQWEPAIPGALEGAELRFRGAIWTRDLRTPR